MNSKRSVVLTMTVTLGVLAAAHPASAATPTMVDAWPAKVYYSVDLDTGSDVDGRDFLVWQRGLG